MNIKDFIAGQWRAGYQYQYFLPTSINQEFYWTDSKLNSLLSRSYMLHRNAAQMRRVTN
ncbi:hypothetical protein [Thioflexithrix psekupsensis]|uniref:hypothetical protein n=1 Tax=Thioflexithrix psekupsensis TaxID=1570016 RepID=UPI001593DF29|nr:hypothetical protein [Thioflexithrix psekupsensis]